MAAKTTFQETTGHEPLGHHRYRRPLTPYEQFMKEEGIWHIQGTIPGTEFLGRSHTGSWPWIRGRRQRDRIGKYLWYGGRWS